MSVHSGTVTRSYPRLHTSVRPAYGRLFYTPFAAVGGRHGLGVVIADIRNLSLSAALDRGRRLPLRRLVELLLIALLLVLLTLFVINRLLRMPIGRAWEALREDEIACRALGMNPTVIKLSAFTLGATFAGFAGSFFAARQGLVSPESFTFIESAIILAIVVLGGMGSQLGVILAAIVMILLPELMREFSEYRMLMFGALMVLMMIWRPQGLLPMQRPHLELKQ